MAGTSLPASGYISDNARDEGEVKQALEDLREVLERQEGADTFELTAGVCPSPTRHVVLVDVEGGAGGPAPDNMTDLATSNAVDGQLVILKNTSASRAVVLKSFAGTGTARLILADNADMTLQDFNSSVLLQWSAALGWVEVARNFGGDQVAERAWLGLGDAATANQGSGNGLDADLLDGQQATAFLGVAAKAADSNLLDGLDSTAFARLAEAAQQDFVGAVATPKVVSNGSAVVEPLLELQRSGSLRGVLRHDSVDESAELRLYDTDGTTVLGRLRVRKEPGGDTVLQYREQTEAAWGDVWTTFQAGVTLPEKYDQVLLIDNSISNPGGTLPWSSLGKWLQHVELPGHCTIPRVSAAFLGSASGAVWWAEQSFQSLGLRCGFGQKMQGDFANDPGSFRHWFDGNTLASVDAAEYADPDASDHVAYGTSSPPSDGRGPYFGAYYLKPSGADDAIYVRLQAIYFTEV